MGRSPFFKLVSLVLGGEGDSFTSTSVLLEKKRWIAGQAILVNIFEVALQRSLSYDK